MSDDEELLYGPLGTQFNIDTDIDTENRRQKLKRKAFDDEVTDEKGRALRFHGAFTGGFHAGYFNTVGSKEGFTPAQFASQGTKGNKSYRQQKPEDFMDDEDFSEHGIAPKLLKTKAVFDDEDIRSQFKRSLGSNSIIGDSDVLKEILVPEKLTIGIVLLRKLGYVTSRGVGDRSDDETDEKDKINGKLIDKFNYECDEIYQLIGHSSKFGLGYVGLQRARKIEGESRAVNFGLKNKRGIRGTAFGTGVDDEEDEDRADHFGDREEMGLGRYNFELIEEEEEEDYWSQRQRKPKAIMEPGSIPGFQLSKRKSTTLRVIYEPPKPSRFYVPIYPIRREKENIELNKNVERPKLMPSEESQSVFNLMSLQDRERLLNLGEKCRSKKGRSRWGEAPPEVIKKEESIIANRIESEKPLEFYKPPENSFKSKKDSRKSWTLTSNLGSMFKSAGISTETQDINYCLETISSKEKDENTEESTKSMAAAQENYGFMTRNVVNWHPDKLLCKRFNIADPYPSSNFAGVPDEHVIEDFSTPIIPEKTESKTPIYSVKQEANNPEPQTPTSSNENIQPITSESTIISSGIEVKTTVLDVSKKPEIDLFKAVFSDSDAEFSSSEDEVEDLTEKSLEKPQDKPQEVEMSIISSLEQALNVMIGGNNNNQPSSSSVTTIKPPLTSDKIYGPALPPDFVPNAVPVTNPPVLVTKHIISKDIRTIPKDPSGIDELYDFKEKSKVKKSKKEKKSKKKKSKKKKTHNSSSDL